MIRATAPSNITPARHDARHYFPPSSRRRPQVFGRSNLVGRSTCTDLGRATVTRVSRDRRSL
jgi:hypothetical protein